MGDYIDRPGKKRAAILEHLVERGGVSTVAELMAEFAGAHTRPRDFKRRMLRMLCEPPAVIVVEGDVVSLAGRWAEALEHARELTGEQVAARLQAQRYARQREAFRRRDEVEADQVPEMRPIPDLRRPWPVHPDGCACPVCEEKFGCVVGEHVEGCNCAGCFTARKEAERSQKRHRVVSLSPHRRTAEAKSPRGRGNGATVSTLRPKLSTKWTPPEDWHEHSLDCECFYCVTPQPSYARPWGAS